MKTLRPTASWSAGPHQRESCGSAGGGGRDGYPIRFDGIFLCQEGAKVFKKASRNVWR
jgi:hypothetical protein